jgi:hypothetical protein
MLIIDDVFWEKKKKKKESLAILLRHWIKIEAQQKKMDFYLKDDLIIVIVMTQ